MAPVAGWQMSVLRLFGACTVWCTLCAVGVFCLCTVRCSCSALVLFCCAVLCCAVLWLFLFCLCTVLCLFELVLLCLYSFVAAHPDNAVLCLSGRSRYMLVCSGTCTDLTAPANQTCPDCPAAQTSTSRITQTAVRTLDVSRTPTSTAPTGIATHKLPRRATPHCGTRTTAPELWVYLGLLYP